jgi:hypothetical protein
VLLVFTFQSNRGSFFAKKKIKNFLSSQRKGMLSTKILSLAITVHLSALICLLVYYLSENSNAYESFGLEKAYAICLIFPIFIAIDKMFDLSFMIIG